jgi:hypothetical protein
LSCQGDVHGGANNHDINRNELDMTDALKQFSVELWAIDAEAAKAFEAGIKQITIAGYFSKSVRNLLRAVEWIAARTDKPLLERLSKMQLLAEIRPPAVIGMKKLTGWN